MVILLIIILLINLPTLYVNNQNSKATLKIGKSLQNKAFHPLKKIKNPDVVPWSFKEKKKSTCHIKNGKIKTP